MLSASAEASEKATAKSKPNSPTGYSERELLFISHYHGNGAEAAIKAGYSAHSARVIASQMLRKDKIKTALELKAQRQVEMAAAVGVVQVRSLLEALRKQGVTLERIAEVTNELLEFGDDPKAPRLPVLKLLFGLFAPPKTSNQSDGYEARVPPGGIIFNYESDWAKEKRLELVS